MNEESGTREPSSSHAVRQGDDPRGLDHVTTEFIIGAYAHGFFPMADPESGEVHLHTSDPRAIIDVESFRAPASAARKLRNGTLAVHLDYDFEAVMRGCAVDRSAENPTWINESMIGLYGRLHREGVAHSAATLHDGRLVGGLYGVAIGAAFFGESMFSLPALGGSDASSAALGVLMAHLRERGFTLFDCQYINDHTRRLGAIEIPAEEYISRLQAAVSQPNRWAVSLGRAPPDPSTRS